MHAPGPGRVGGDVFEAEQVGADREDDGVAARQAMQRLQLNAQVNQFAGIFRGHDGPVRCPFRQAFGRDFEARVDRQRPVQTPHRMPGAQAQQELQRTVEHADFFHQRHRAVEFFPAHAEVESQRIVGALGGDARPPVQCAVALLLQHPVALGLAGHVLHRLVGQGGRVTEGEAVVNVQQAVGPVPLAAFTLQAEVLRVVPGVGFHDQFEQIPLRLHHVRRRDIVHARVFLQGDRPVAAFADVMLVDIERGAEGTVSHRDMGLEVHRVHVIVIGKREGRAGDAFRAVGEGVVVAVGFVGIEWDVHCFFSPSIRGR